MLGDKQQSGAQVLFCKLTAVQRDLYRAYISSKEVEDILNVRPSC